MHKLVLAKPLKNFKAEVQTLKKAELSKVTNFGRQSGRLPGIETNTFSEGKLCVGKVKELLNGN